MLAAAAAAVPDPPQPAPSSSSSSSRSDAPLASTHEASTHEAQPVVTQRESSAGGQDDLAMLPPEHPLLRRAQEALRRQLAEQKLRLQEELRERKKALKVRVGHLLAGTGVFIDCICSSGPLALLFITA